MQTIYKILHLAEEVESMHVATFQPFMIYCKFVINCLSSIYTILPCRDLHPHTIHIHKHFFLSLRLSTKYYVTNFLVKKTRDMRQIVLHYNHYFQSLHCRQNVRKLLDKSTTKLTVAESILSCWRFRTRAVSSTSTVRRLPLWARPVEARLLDARPLGAVTSSLGWVDAARAAARVATLRVAPPRRLTRPRGAGW